MPSRKLGAETLAIIHAIEAASAKSKNVSDAVARELVTHTQHDDERFVALTALVTSIATDVKSLLDSRSFTRGAWKAIVMAASAAGAMAGLIISYLRH